MSLFVEVGDKEYVLEKVQFNILCSLPEQYAPCQKRGDCLGPELCNESASHSKGKDIMIQKIKSAHPLPVTTLTGVRV